MDLHELESEVLFTFCVDIPHLSHPESDPGSDVNASDRSRAVLGLHYGRNEYGAQEKWEIFTV